MILSCSTPWSRSWMQEASTAWRSKNATGRNQHCSLVCKLGPCNKLRFVVSVNESFLEQIHFLSNIRPLFEANMKARSVQSVWQVAILMKVKQCVKSLLVFVVGHISCYFHQLTLSVRRSRKGKKTERLGKSGEETFIFCLSSTTNKEAISIWLKLRRMSEVRVQIISLPLFSCWHYFENGLETLCLNFEQTWFWRDSRFLFWREKMVRFVRLPLQQATFILFQNSEFSFFWTHFAFWVQTIVQRKRLETINFVASNLTAQKLAWKTRKKSCDKTLFLVLLLKTTRLQTRAVPNFLVENTWIFEVHVEEKFKPKALKLAFLDFHERFVLTWSVNTGVL